MAALSSSSSSSLSSSLSSSIHSHFNPILFPTHNKLQPLTSLSIPNSKTIKIRATNSTPKASFKQLQNPTNHVEDEKSISVDILRRFVHLNLGVWNGSFHQFDANGKLVHKVTTKLSAGSYGEDELISLIQTLYIKQPSSSTSISDNEEETEWAEYKIKESNMFTVDKYQQLGFFPDEKAFALRYQTAGMLETVLRQGVLGEDDTGEQFPRNLKLPSSWPSIVCENCLYSIKKDMRARAFHIMDPKGILEMLLIFLEEKGSNIDIPPSLKDSEHDVVRLQPFLGQWKGHSVTKRSGVYGATIAEHDIVASLEINENGQLIQDITSTPKGGDVTTNVEWKGTICDNLVTFDKGYQLTLLPGGMYMGYPQNLAKNVAESTSFHLEFCWLESSDTRQRLVRTYDAEGQAVSSTYFLETKL